MNLNTTNIIGRVGRDPEWKDVGKGLCKFSVAVGKRYKKGDEWVEDTTWFDVAVWGEFGKRMMERLHKGMLVYVAGPHESRKHEDKYYWTLTAQTVIPLEKREVPAAKVADDDELPFS